MDAHFSEYLAAVVGMQDLYGQPVEDHPTEFHEELSTSALVTSDDAAAVVLGSGI